MRGFINHPVHVFDKNGDLSPSAFIPMCKFGGVDEDSKTNFDLGFPVCKSFKPVIHFDQICYEVDLNEKFKKGDDLLMDLRGGIVLSLDYNKDRQTGMIDELKDQKATVYFNTISTNLKVSIVKKLFLCAFLKC